ncbi:MAG: serine/threonine-protein kinase [Myxococcota bacterium]|jgi:tRNA A-37 threonylcarbamoyl transferase component Bud32|nr:serine/threonine-protein kinase [Myxococcota bacterium]
MGLKQFLASLFSTPSKSEAEPAAAGNSAEQGDASQRSEHHESGSDPQALLRPLLDAQSKGTLDALRAMLAEVFEEPQFRASFDRLCSEDPRAALNLLRRYEDTLGEQPVILEHQAKLYDSTRDDEAARAVLLRLSTFSEHEAGAWERLARIAERSGDGEQARDYFERALLLNWGKAELLQACERLAPERVALPPSLTLLAHQPPAGYTLLHRLGRGAYGTVYKAVEQALDRPVAIKFLHEHLRRRPEAEQSFLSEARTLARFSHPSILAIYDIFPQHGALVMEYIPEGSLASRMENGPLAPQAALSCASAVCLALDVLHQEGIAHGDVKPENVLFRSQREVVLADFGLSDTEPTLGTAAYLPRDAHSFSAVACDIHAVGLMLQEMLSGVRVFHVTDRGAWIRSAMERFPESLQRDVSQLFDALSGGDEGKLPSSAMQAALLLSTLRSRLPADDELSTAVKLR